ncbi:hypothetical protein STEG23_018050 [Scotinomys teguina]
MARKAGQGKEEEESRARQQEEKTPACDGRGHHVVEQDISLRFLLKDEEAGCDCSKVMAIANSRLELHTLLPLPAILPMGRKLVTVYSVQSTERGINNSDDNYTNRDSSNIYSPSYCKFASAEVLSYNSLVRFTAAFHSQFPLN